MSVRVVIKVCGIASEDAVEAAIAVGVGAVGFVFDANSNRRVDIEKASRLAAMLLPSICRVGVFVDANGAEMQRAMEAAGLNWIQVYGNARDLPSTTAGHRLTVIRVVGVGVDGRISASSADLHGSDWVLFDTRVRGKAGGTGAPFDWTVVPSLRARLAGARPVMLAGGLNPNNVARALTIAQPDGVDVSSGVEAKGRKDMRLMHAFINAVREWEAAHAD